MNTQRLRDTLDQLDMSAADLSRLTGIGKSSISMYMSGQHEPPAEKMALINKALNLPYGYLNDETPGNNVTINEAAKAMGKSPNFVREGLKRQIFPFGFAVKVDKRYSFYISREKFAEYTGVTL